MSVEFYADYVRHLRTLFAELDQHPERFQTYDVHIELAASGKLVVYETKRRKGQTDSLYYGRSGPGARSPRRRPSPPSIISWRSASSSPSMASWKT